MPTLKEKKVLEFEKNTKTEQKQLINNFQMHKFQCSEKTNVKNQSIKSSSKITNLK